MQFRSCRTTNLFILMVFMLGTFSFLTLVSPTNAAEKKKKTYIYTELQIGKFKDSKRAISLIKEAAKKLKYPIYPSLKNGEKIPESFFDSPRQVGAVIQAYHDQEKNIVVTAYLGDASHGKKSWAHYKNYIQKHYPKAKQVSIRQSLDDLDVNQYYAAYQVSDVIILGSYKSYAQALKEVRRVSKKSGVEYDARGHVYHPEKGLIVSEEDDVHGGFYSSRRYNVCAGGPPCLSIEVSDYYNGFTSGYFIVVGGVFSADSKEPELQKTLKKFKKYVPDAYSKLTEIYMGCRS